MLSCFNKRGGRALVSGLCAMFACLVIGERVADASIGNNAIEFRDQSAMPGKVVPGGSVSVVVGLTNNTRNLVGYQLEAKLISDGLVGGSIQFDLNASNFDAGENVIAKGGGTLNPFIKYLTNSNRNIFFSAFNSDAGTPVALAKPGHDTLAEIVFNVSPDAEGTFGIQLGSLTELYDRQLDAIPITTPTPSILEWQIVPEPTCLSVLLLGSLLVCRKRKKI